MIICVLYNLHNIAIEILGSNGQKGMGTKIYIKLGAGIVSNHNPS